VNPQSAGKLRRLYGDLLDYGICGAHFLCAYNLRLFVLRRKRPDAPRPYRAFGYPLVPALYIVLAVAIMVVLILYKTQTTWPGLLIVLMGVPVYLVWSRRAGAKPDSA
jgi:APA family basic amino acid/polyamine antiporter